MDKQGSLKWVGLLPLFFISGISGLIYQSVWVRQFGDVFGNTVHSASLVTAVYMLGLGVGSYWGGRWADRAYQNGGGLTVLYGRLELAIAAFGALIALVLPKLSALSSAVSWYQVGVGGWSELTAASYLLRYLGAVVLLGPITALMGATLTVLIREVVSDRPADSGWKIGLLYGVNTGGAALGSLLVDLYCVPAFGLLATQIVAVMLNCAAGVTALVLAPRFARTNLLPARVAPVASMSWQTVAVAAAVFFSGVSAMGLEIVWFRFVSGAIAEHRSVFSLLLFVILVAMWAGSTAAGYLHRRLGHPLLLYGVSQVALVISALALLEGYAPAAVSSELVRIWSVAGLPAFFMGFAFPLANAGVQSAVASVGQSSGMLYLANTVGAVCGALGAGFILLPWLGMQGAVSICCLCSAAAVAVLAWAARVEKYRWPSLVLSAALALLLVVYLAWSRLPGDFLVFKIFARPEIGGHLLDLTEGLTEAVGIGELPNGTGRVLYTNGHVMSGTPMGVQRYMRAFVHVPLLQLESPSSALVICFGVGNTLHAASLYPSMKRLDVADLSSNVLNHAGFFSQWNHDVLKDPRVHVFLNDGRQHLRMQPEDSYDLITLEPPPITNAGVAALYAREFYALARSRLRHGGFLTQWLPAYQVPQSVVRSIVRAFVDVFPDAVLLSGYKSHLILMGRKDLKPEIDPAAVQARLAGLPAVRDDLDRVHLGTLTELVGTFAADGATMDLATRGARALTDDHPLMEYPEVFADVSASADLVLPKGLIDTSKVDVWCPNCHAGGRTARLVPKLDEYLGFLGSYYASPTLLYQGVSGSGPAPVLMLSRADTRNLTELLKWSSYIQAVFGRP